MMRAVLTCLLLGSIVALAPATEVLETDGVIDAVTVYRGQALVTRVVDVPGPTGLRELLIGALPEQVLPHSIHAEASDGLEVRSVRYRVRPVREDVRAEVRELDGQIRGLEDQVEALDRAAEVFAGRKEYLAKLENFTAVTADTELTRGVLNAETVRELSGFIFKTRDELVESELAQAREKRAVVAQLDLLRRKRGELTSGSNRVRREAVVFVNLTRESGARLRLRYLVNNANWTPSYNVRTDEARSGVVVEYNASIQQMTGEDWPNVQTTLSTATPSLVAKAPTLDALRVALRRPGQGDEQQQMRKGGKAYQDAKLQLSDTRRRAENQRAQFGNEFFDVQQTEMGPQQQAMPGNVDEFDRVLNSMAVELQVLDFNAGKLMLAGGSRQEAGAEGISVTYELAARTTLPSRSDRQLVRIAAIPLDAEFYRLATPVLTSYVYEDARVVNKSSRVLLAGPVSTYVGGEFVGHGDLPTVAMGESFTVGLGIDASLRVHRELVNKTEKIQGGNRIVDFKYALAVENFASEPTAVRVLERMPTHRGDALKITLSSTKPALCDAADYQETDRKRGILRWDVVVPPASIGMDSHKVEYELRLEYDKEMAIVGVPAEED